MIATRDQRASGPGHGGGVPGVAGVEPLGPSAATRCPVRTQLDVLRPVTPAPPGAIATVLGEVADRAEHDVVGRLLARHEAVVVPAGGDARQRTADTVGALADGVPLVIGGRLPVDEEGRRAGGPDLLVRSGGAPVAGRWRYAPVIVTAHGTLRAQGDGTDVVVDTLDELAVPGATDVPRDVGRSDRTACRDTLRLAHHHRLLAAAGHAATGVAWGGVLGREGAVAWYALDEARWTTATTDRPAPRSARSSLELYDDEFGLRRDVAAAAAHHARDPDVPLLVEPVRCRECPGCPWREHCLPQLERRDDPSLLPRVDRPVWRALRDAGVTTIEAVARSDAPTVVDGLDPEAWAELRLQARARVASSPVLPRHGTAVPRPPRADVEVDVDMENVLAGAYLWGALVTDRVGVGDLSTGYHPFVTWEAPLDESGRADCFVRFWSWLTSLRATCDARGLSFAAYCWYEAAENRYLREGAALAGCRDEVERFIASSSWIDLHRWFGDHLVTGRGNGLKTVATALGFGWRDDDPSGASSMLWHAAATDRGATTADRAAARARLLTYNEDDVLATLAVRDRLDQLAAGVGEPG